jgi:hypothetical protein
MPRAIACVSSPAASATSRRTRSCEAADRDLETVGEKLLGEIDGARELVALHPDHQHDAALAGARDGLGDPPRMDAGVRLVVGRDGDRPRRDRARAARRSRP